MTKQKPETECWKGFARNNSKIPNWHLKMLQVSNLATKLLAKFAELWLELSNFFLWMQIQNINRRFLVRHIFELERIRRILRQIFRTTQSYLELIKELKSFHLRTTKNFISSSNFATVSGTSKNDDCYKSGRMKTKKIFHQAYQGSISIHDKNKYCG